MNRRAETLDESALFTESTLTTASAPVERVRTWTTRAASIHAMRVAVASSACPGTCPSSVRVPAPSAVTVKVTESPPALAVSVCGPAAGPSVQEADALP